MENKVSVSAVSVLERKYVCQRERIRMLERELKVQRFVQYMLLAAVTILEIAMFVGGFA